MAEVLLINPPDTEQNGFSNPPLNLLYLAAYGRQHGVATKIVDGCVADWDAVTVALHQERPSIVGITCLTPFRQQSIQAARLVKQLAPQAMVVLGGAHATIMYRQLLKNYPEVDVVVLGEGEETFADLCLGKPLPEITGIAYRANGDCRKNPPRKYIENLDEIPFPAWDLIDFQAYLTKSRELTNFNLSRFNGISLRDNPRMSVIFSRGCPGHCTFCSTWWIWKGWRQRSPENFLDELILLYEQYGVRHFWVADDAFSMNPEAAMEICRLILERGLRIAWLATIRSDACNPQMFAAMRAAGCYGVSIGIESGSDLILEHIKKNNKVANGYRAVVQAKAAGLKVCTLIMVGNVGETRDTIHESIRFLRETQPDEIGTAGGVMLMPGTSLYQRAKREKLIDDDFWLGRDPYQYYTAEHSVATLHYYRWLILRRRYDSVISRIWYFIDTKLPVKWKAILKKVLLLKG